MSAHRSTEGIFTSCPVNHDSGKIRHIGDPATVLFLLKPSSFALAESNDDEPS
jgi:hypothetical protein